jgi:hypothetical protein
MQAEERHYSDLAGKLMGNRQAKSRHPGPGSRPGHGPHQELSKQPLGNRSRSKSIHMSCVATERQLQAEDLQGERVLNSLCMTFLSITCT